MFPSRISLAQITEFKPDSTFGRLWQEAMDIDCHRHVLWSDPFVRALNDDKTFDEVRFALASVWSTNMVSGSFCFPRYVAALAARTEVDAVRYGLLENAWDESGSSGHSSRSHFWLAVRLAGLLGLSESEIERIVPLPGAQVYTDEHYSRCSQGDFGFALGMICLIEEFTTPEFTMIFKAFLRSCESALDITSEEFVLKGGAEYFTANIADDERHRREMPSLVATWLHSNGVNLESDVDVAKALVPVRDGARYSADLRQAFFNGIYSFVEQGGRFRDLTSPQRVSQITAGNA